MEIDNLKEFWNKDQEALPEVPLEKQDEIFSPLEMIRINMKTEFWLLIITLPSLLYGFPFDNTNVNITRIAAFEVFLTIGFMTYFYTRFIKLYRMLRTTGINTNYDLFNIKTQLLVSKEIYISYYISYIPLAFLISLINDRKLMNGVIHQLYIAVILINVLILLNQNVFKTLIINKTSLFFTFQKKNSRVECSTVEPGCEITFALKVSIGLPGLVDNFLIKIFLIIKIIHIHFGDLKNNPLMFIDFFEILSFFPRHEF